MFQFIRAKPDLKKVLNQTHVFSISGIPYSLDASMSPEGRREFEIWKSKNLLHSLQRSCHFLFSTFSSVFRLISVQQRQFKTQVISFESNLCLRNTRHFSVKNNFFLCVPWKRAKTFFQQIFESWVNNSRPKMAGRPTEFSEESVRQFMLAHGGRVTNHELVKHFKSW